MVRIDNAKMQEKEMENSKNVFGNDSIMKTEDDFESGRDVSLQNRV